MREQGPMIEWVDGLLIDPCVCIAWCQVGRFSFGGWLWGLRRQCRLQWNLMTGSKAVVFL